MDLTFDDIVATLDAKIGSVKAEITVLQDRLESLIRARKALVPEEDEPGEGDLPPGTFKLALSADGLKIEHGRGAMRRLALECLPEGEVGITIRDLIERMKERGFAFRAHNPEVSLNEILQFYRNKGEARIVKRTIQGNYWVRRNRGDSAGRDQNEINPREH